MQVLTNPCSAPAALQLARGTTRRWPPGGAAVRGRAARVRAARDDELQEALKAPAVAPPPLPARPPTRRVPHASSNESAAAVASDPDPAAQANGRAGAAAAPPARAGGLPWYGVVSLSAMAALICSIDRAAISVAILPMAAQYGWSDTTKGAVNAAFYMGYTLTNLAGGYLAASAGSKQTLGTGVVVWSGFTMLTPAAAMTRAMPALLGVRFLMGAGEGVAYPAIQQVVKSWVPADSRSRALTLIYSGGQLGTILALLTAPAIIEHFGWEAVFVVYGALGVLWTAAWFPLVSNVPPLTWQQDQKQQQGQLGSGSGVGESSSLVTAALDASSSGGADAAASSSSNGGEASSSGVVVGGGMPPLTQLPWRRFLSNRAFQGIIIAHSAFGAGHYLLLSFLPSFYYSSFDLDVSQSATLSIQPWLAAIPVSSCSGWLADWLTNAGHLDMTRTRKLLQVAGSVGPAICLLALADSLDSGLGLGSALALLTGAVALGGFQSAGFASNHQDIAGRYASLLFGFTNALSSLVGSASVYATGSLLDAGYSWAFVFQLVAGIYLVGAAGYVALGSGERQFE